MTPIDYLIRFAKDRIVVCRALDRASSAFVSSPFVALVPAYTRGEREGVEAFASSLIDMGCVEFSCVGPEAEQLHDSLDRLIEDREMSDIVTTWITNETEACEYFLFAAGGAPGNLLAIVSDHPALAGLLEQVARANQLTVPE